MRKTICYPSVIALCHLLMTAAVAQTGSVLAPIQDDPALPRVLLIGDSISIGYTLPVRQLLAGKANVHRAPDNCGPTSKGLEQIEAWLGSARWDVIHFNFGIWDAHILEDGQYRVPIERYESNLRQLVATLESTGANLIWASTTPIKSIKSGALRLEASDIPSYGAVAKQVMEENSIPINDLHGAVLPRVDELRATDGVHYSLEGQKFLAQIVAENIMNALASTADPFLIDRPGIASTVIVRQADTPLIRLMADRLADYLKRRTGLRPKIVQGLPHGDKDGVVFVLARESDPAIRSMPYGPDASLPDMANWRDDGYAIRTATRDRTKYVICAGKAETGIKYSVYRLMREMTTKGLTVTVPPLQVQANPFFKGRHCTPSSAMAGGAPSLIQKHYCWENWDVSRVPAIADFLDAAGMNGVWLFDSPCRYDWTGNHVPPEEMAVKIRALAKQVRANGMTTCLWVHATSNLRVRSFSELQPRDPEQYQQILEDYDRLVEQYGDVIDMIYAHWVDPGGAPPPADITDPQRLHMDLTKRLEAKAGKPLYNVFSAHGLHWPLGPGGTLPWAGYEGPETLIEGGILPKGICIGSPEMRIHIPSSLEFARKVRTGGYTCGLFGWLVAEYEMNPGIHVHTHLMDNYFHSIPEEAKELFDWYEEGLVYTTMNLPTYYVFSQMLWDPYSSADQHLQDFCQAAFGPELGPLMLQGYRAIADVRCGTGVGADRGGCRLGRGSADAVRDLRICDEALSALERAYADKGYLSTIPLTVPTEAMISDLRGQLQGMAKYARFRLASEKVGTIIAGGGSEPDIREAIAAVPKLEAWPGSTQPKAPGTWGMPEYFHCEDVLGRWRLLLQNMAAGGVPEAKGDILFADDFSEYPEGADGRPSWQTSTDAPDNQPKPQWMTEYGKMGVNIPGPGGSLANATGLLLTGEAEWKDYSVQFRTRLIRESDDGGSVGVRVRVIGGDRPETQSGYVVRLSSHAAEFGWLAGGKFKPLQKAELSLEPGEWYTVRVDCQSIYCKIYLNGRLLLGGDDWYGSRKGQVALEVRNAQAAFDDFSVRAIE